MVAREEEEDLILGTAVVVFTAVVEEMTVVVEARGAGVGVVLRTGAKDKPGDCWGGEGREGRGAAVD